MADVYKGSPEKNIYEYGTPEGHSRFIVMIVRNRRLHKSTGSYDTIEDARVARESLRAALPPPHVTAVDKRRKQAVETRRLKFLSEAFRGTSNCNQQLLAMCIALRLLEPADACEYTVITSPRHWSKPSHLLARAINIYIDNLLHQRKHECNNRDDDTPTSGDSESWTPGDTQQV